MCAHDFYRGGAGYLGIAVLADCGAVGLQRDAGLLQVGRKLIRELAIEAGDFLQGVVDGIQRGLFGFDFAAVGVAAHLEAGLLNQLAQVDDAVELADAVALQQSLFNFSDLEHRIVGGIAQFAAGVFAVGTGLRHGVEGALVGVDRR